MGKLWQLNGPDGDKYTLLQLAEILGYDSVDTVRRLAAEGRLPAPRGYGGALYYTGLDVAIILEMFGRWAPQPQPDVPATADKKPQRPSKNRNEPQTPESEDEP